jgi:hypothetical protein
MQEVDSRKDFHDAVQDVLSEEEGVLSGWVLVYETVRPDDNRYLTVMTADATGENNLPPWTSEGWLSYIVNSGIPGFEEDDDEEFEEDDD